MICYICAFVLCTNVINKYLYEMWSCLMNSLHDLIVLSWLQWIWRIRGLRWWQHNMHLCHSMTIIYLWRRTNSDYQLSSCYEPQLEVMVLPSRICNENWSSHQASSFPSPSEFPSHLEEIHRSQSYADVVRLIVIQLWSCMC